MARKEFTRKTKRIIIERAGGKCEKCKAVLKTGECEIDHIIPDAFKGDNQPANGQLLCRVCHAAKTAKDVPAIRKADRRRDKRSGAMKPKGRIKSAGFQSQRNAPRIEKTTLKRRSPFTGNVMQE